MNHIKKFIIALGLLFLPLIHSGYSADEEDCDRKEYTCYEKRVSVCTDKNAPWAGKDDLGSIAKPYTAFNATAIDKLIADLPASQTSEEEKKILTKKLELLKSREFEGFRAAEAVRVLYRANMNNIFSCAIIASRADKLKKLSEIIGKHQNKSDLTEKLAKEYKKYESLKTKLTCVQNATEDTNVIIVDRLAISATKEYCYYTHYLDYLEENLKNDFTKSVEIDGKIAGNTGSNSPNNTEYFAQSMSSRLSKLESERTRAFDTLPKAVMAFQEMDRTYIVHLLLTVIADDYLNLRDNLNTYLAIVGQTFEKAYNAQDANKR